MYLTDSLPQLVFNWHQQKEMQRQLHLICYLQEHKHDLPLSFVPKTVSLFPHLEFAVEAFSLDRPEDDREFTLPKLEFAHTEESFGDILAYFGNHRHNNKDKLRNAIVATFFMSSFHYALFHKNIDSVNEEKLVYQIERFIDTNFGIGEEAQVLRSLRELDILTETSINDFYEIVQAILENASQIHENGQVDFPITPDTQPFLNRFLQLIESDEVFRFFHFKWHGTSSGEQAMLTLFARFYAVSKNPALADSVLILIDSAEVAFHPEWQQKYMLYLVNTLPIIFPQKVIQLVIASHSPFVLADFPHYAVRVLERSTEGITVIKQPQKATWAAPVHQLFIQEKQPLQPALAQHKLNDLIRYLQEGTIAMPLSTAQKYVQLLGDALLRKQLQQLLDSKKTDDMWAKVERVYHAQQKLLTPKQEISLLKQRLVDLEQMLKSIENDSAVQ